MKTPRIVLGLPCGHSGTHMSPYTQYRFKNIECDKKIFEKNTEKKCTFVTSLSKTEMGGQSVGALQHVRGIFSAEIKRVGFYEVGRKLGKNNNL